MRPKVSSPFYRRPRGRAGLCFGTLVYGGRAPFPVWRSHMLPKVRSLVASPTSLSQSCHARGLKPELALGGTRPGGYRRPKPIAAGMAVGRRVLQAYDVRFSPTPKWRNRTGLRHPSDGPSSHGTLKAWPANPPMDPGVPDGPWFPPQRDGRVETAEDDRIRLDLGGVKEGQHVNRFGEDVWAEFVGRGKSLRRAGSFKFAVILPLTAAISPGVHATGSMAGVGRGRCATCKGHVVPVNENSVGRRLRAGRAFVRAQRNAW